MKFDELDKRMRVFETSHDYCVLPGLYIVARIDGRCFTRLTKEVHKFKSPYDPVFRDYMVETTKHLMTCGFRIVYGYTQSDEISLLFHPGENSFQRKLRKLNSVLAGEASAKFSLLLGDIGTFDCRISQLPTDELVIDYFRWRNEDAHRNALNSHAYWALRKSGKRPAEASEFLLNMSVADKNELLFQKGINFNTLPNWQKRGVGIYWETYEKEGYNPVTCESVTAIRNRLKVDLELPMKDAYGEFIRKISR
ncbi:tRNA(His) guanylyltransferase Thg1 family protein [Desulfobacterales bacterium HSG2]|nr:tRNA(His) guanylyltransferase Thg1 family protein [Desulfobacterales bacterium HSG2]